MHKWIEIISYLLIGIALAISIMIAYRLFSLTVALIRLGGW